MALNRSGGTGSHLGRKTGNTATRASGIPAATTRNAKSSDNSADVLTKVGTNQSNDGKLATETSTRQRSFTSGRQTIPGRAVGNGAETDIKQNAKTVASSSASSHSTPKPLVKVTQKLDRSSPRVTGVVDVNSTIAPEVHCKSEGSASKVNHPSSLPLAVPGSKVDRPSTKVLADHQKAGAVGTSTTKRSSPGSSAGGKGPTKTKSPPLACRTASEAAGKADARGRKTTGIAKLQNPPSSSRPLGGCRRLSLGTSSVSSSRAPSGQKPYGSNELSASLSTGGKAEELGRKESRPRAGSKLDNSNGGTSVGHRKPNSTVKIPKSRALNNVSSKKNSVQELKSIAHSSRDTISKSLEDSVENTSECEYFLETKSNISENTSDLGDDTIALDLNAADLEGERLSALRENLEASTTLLDISSEDIFTSCEDIMSELTHCNEEISRNLNISSDFKLNNILTDNDDITATNSNQAPELYITDEDSGKENEADLLTDEDAVANHLQIVENAHLFTAEENTDCDRNGNSTVTDNFPNAIDITGTVLLDSQNNELASRGELIIESDDALVDHEFEKTQNNTRTCTTSDNVNINSSGHQGKIDIEMNNESNGAGNTTEVSVNEHSNSDDVDLESGTISRISNVEIFKNSENVSLNTACKELQTKDTACSESQIELTSTAISSESGDHMKTGADGFSVEGQTVVSDDSLEGGQDTRSSSNCNIIDGVGADGIADSEREPIQSGPVGFEADFQDSLPADSSAIAAAAASGGETTGDDVDKDHGQSSGTVVGDLHQTITCSGESDVDAEASSSAVADGVSAAGILGCVVVSNHLAREVVDDDCQTGFQRRPQDLTNCHGNEKESILQNDVTSDPACKHPTDAETPKDISVNSLRLHEEKALDGKSSDDEIGVKCEAFAEDCSLPTRPDPSSSRDGCSDVSLDVKPAVEIKDNDPICLPTKQCLLGSGAGQLLSACFIKEFSAWLPDSATDSLRTYVPGRKLDDPNNDDVYDQSEGQPDDQNLSDSSMNRKRDLRLIVIPIADGNKELAETETNDARKEEVQSGERFDTSLPADSILGRELRSSPMGLDAREPSSNTTLKEFSLTDLPGSTEAPPDSMPFVTSSTDQSCILGNLTTSSLTSSDSTAISNHSTLCPGKNSETFAIQNSVKRSVEGDVHPSESSADDITMKCTAKAEEEENCTGSSNGTSLAVTARDKVKDLEAKPAPNNSPMPLSFGGLCFGSSAKELDHSMHRAPSPLSVLAVPCRSTEIDRAAYSQNFPDSKSSDMPLLSVNQFRPIAVEDYFAVSSNDSLNAEQQNSEIVTALQSLSGKVIKDANHNVVRKAETVSTSASVDRSISSEIRGFMSPNYVPSRPLSQVCARTIGKSLLRRSAGYVVDGSNNSSLTSVESLESNGPERRADIIAQIHIARSCSRTGLAKGPSMTQSDSLMMSQSCFTPRPPVAAGSLPSFELHRSCSGKTLRSGASSSSFSQAVSSRHSLCSTPVIGEGSSPCPSPARASMFEISSRDASRNGTPIPRHNDDVHGSAASLTSISSSLYSVSLDEKHAMEIKKLRHELETARETIVSLTTQLNVNTLMSKSYEQNIDGLTQRLKQLTTIIDQKESELCELRVLKNSSLPSDGCGISGLQTIPDCISVSSSSHRRASASASLPYDARSAGLKYLPVLTRHISCESVTSFNSQSSSCSMGSQQSNVLCTETKKKKKNWIRSSFSKAFSRKKNKPGSVSEADSLSLRSDNSASESIAVENPPTPSTISSPSEGLQVSPEGIVTDLEEKLREADRHLTDLRLDSLASIQHIEQLQETISCLEQQVATLKAENKSLHRRLLDKGASQTTTNNQHLKRLSDHVLHHDISRSTPSQGAAVKTSCSSDGQSRLTVSTPHCEMSSPKLLQRFSLVDAMASDASCDQLRRIAVFVMSDLFGGETAKAEEDSAVEKMRQIGVLLISEQATWQDLDMRLCNLFVEHIHILDPDAGLGLDEKSIASYQLGSQERIPNSKMPDIFPSKFLTAANASIKIRLQDWQEDCVDLLAFETLIPKPLLIQYVSLLNENRRLLFCGPNLSGKTFLAKKLARHLVLRKEKRLTSVSIAHFTVDSKSNKELQQYLSNIVGHCERGSDRLPSVILIDNLHLADNLSKAFSGFLSLSSQSCPYLIGTMTQSRAASITCLQFHQNFRWALFSLTEEPVKSFLARYLHRQWAEKQFRQSGSEDGDCGLLRVVDWMPKVWQHINRFVASVCCLDKCIGPGIFLSCPMDVDKAHSWFVDLWNYSIGPYLLQLLKDSSVQSGNNRVAREDPTDWVLETSPWENSRCKGSESRVLPLLRLFPYSDSSISWEQNRILSPMGKEILPKSSSRSDPLLDMLLHLQVTSCHTDSSIRPSNSVSKSQFTGLKTTSPNIKANSNSLHSAAS